MISNRYECCRFRFSWDPSDKCSEPVGHSHNHSRRSPGTEIRHWDRNPFIYCTIGLKVSLYSKYVMQNCVLMRKEAELFDAADSIVLLVVIWLILTPVKPSDSCVWGLPAPIPINMVIMVFLECVKYKYLKWFQKNTSVTAPIQYCWVPGWALAFRQSKYYHINKNVTYCCHQGN